MAILSDKIFPTTDFVTQANVWFTDTPVFGEKLPSNVAEKEPDMSNDVFQKYIGCEYLVYYPRESHKKYSNNTVNPGNLHFVNINSLLARFFIGVYSNCDRIDNWREYCIGAISYNYAGRGDEVHMPMFDYDGKNVKTRVKKDVKLLQEKYGVGDAWVYKTKKGFHVYFFTDLVTKGVYENMLHEVKCCEGFREASLSAGYGTLRVSAKYTKFDIELEYILRSKVRTPNRMLRKAHLIQELIGMGQESGTHLASLFPQWARYREDYSDWKPSSGKKRSKAVSLKYTGAKKYGKGKRIKKIPAGATPAPPTFVPENATIKYDSYESSVTVATTTASNDLTTYNMGIPNK